MNKFHVKEKASFQVRILGDVSEVWKDWFTNVHIDLEEDAIVLQTDPIDQSGLIGLLQNLSSLGYFILSVQIQSAQDGMKKEQKKEETWEKNKKPVLRDVQRKTVN